MWSLSGCLSKWFWCTMKCEDCFYSHFIYFRLMRPKEVKQCYSVFFKWDLHPVLPGSKVCPYPPIPPQGGLAFPPATQPPSFWRELQNRGLETAFDTVSRDSIAAVSMSPGGDVWFLAYWLKSWLIRFWSCFLLLKQKFFEISFSIDFLGLSHLRITRTSHPWKVIMVVSWVWKTYSL